MGRGGARPGAGRPRKAGPKKNPQPVWCGSLSDEERKFILENLTPVQRGQALLSAARALERTCHNCRHVMHWWDADGTDWDCGKAQREWSNEETRKDWTWMLETNEPRDPVKQAKQCKHFCP